MLGLDEKEVINIGQIRFPTTDEDIVKYENENILLKNPYSYRIWIAYFVTKILFRFRDTDFVLNFP